MIGMVGQSAYALSAPPKEVGETIPANTPHAVSVTLPTWRSNVAYEEGEHWVHSKMRSGYPRYPRTSIGADLGLKYMRRSRRCPLHNCGTNSLAG